MSAAPVEIAGEKALPRLRAGALSLMDAVGQSLAAVGPTLTPALNLTVVAALAGVGCWMSYFLGTLGVVIVAASVAVLAARHPEAGSYFVYVGRTFGPLTGALAGWAMISAYLFTAISTSFSFPIFLGDLLQAFHISFPQPAKIASVLVYIGTVTFGAYRDIKLSSRAGLVMEVISLSIIVTITVLFVHVHGTVVDPVQLDVGSLKWPGVFSALPFVIFSFVGFESSATLAKESANPKRNIPRSVMGCAAFSGIFFTLMAYFMVLGNGDDTVALGKSTAPFTDVAARAGFGSAATIVYGGAVISVFACTLASVNAAARLLYSMGKYRFLHRSMGLVHHTHRTPHRAIVVCGCLLALVCMSLWPVGALNAFGYTGTIASFGFVVVYIALCIVAPLDLRKSGEMRPLHIINGGCGTVLMLFVMVGSVYPTPEYPYNLLPYLFFVYMAVGGSWFAYLKWRSPQVLATIQHDMEEGS
jgi:amino acid transporter